MPYTPILATLGYVLSPDRRRVLMIHRNARGDDHYLDGAGLTFLRTKVVSSHDPDVVSLRLVIPCKLPDAATPGGGPQE